MEHPAEMALVREPASKCDLGERDRRVPEQGLRALHTLSQYILMRRCAGALLEDADEAVDAHSRQSSEGLNRHIAVEIRVDVVEGRSQGSRGQPGGPRPSLIRCR